MTSLEIAELTGKQHKNVMQAIRNMEPAWTKITGLNFQLCEKTYSLKGGKKVPMMHPTATPQGHLYPKRKESCDEINVCCEII